MARINIEEECFSRLSKLVDLIGCDAREALGTLAFLWHDSQDILKTHGTFEEIVDWCRITKLPESEQTKWIKTLCKARFITEVEPDWFLIHGNETQIENRLKHLEKSKKGAESTRKKWEEMRSKGKGHRKATGHATGLAQADQCQTTTRLNTIQGNAIQGNAMQDSTNQDISGGGQAPTRTGGVGSAIWEAYQEAYRGRYGVDPVRNATTNSQCAALAKRLGESAVEVVKFYLTHNDGYYLRSQHPIGLCLAQAESLHTQWQRGVAVTANQVRQFENQHTTKSAVEEALEIMNRRNEQ